MDETFVIFISMCLLAGITGKPARRCCSRDIVPSCLCLQDEDLEVCQFEEHVPIIEVRGYCKCSILYHEVVSTPPVVVNSERATCSWHCKSGLCVLENGETTTNSTKTTTNKTTRETTKTSETTTTTHRTSVKTTTGKTTLPTSTISTTSKTISNSTTTTETTTNGTTTSTATDATGIINITDLIFNISSTTITIQPEEINNTAGSELSKIITITVSPKFQINFNESSTYMYVTNTTDNVTASMNTSIGYNHVVLNEKLTSIIVPISVTCIAIALFFIIIIIVGTIYKWKKKKHCAVNVYSMGMMLKEVDQSHIDNQDDDDDDHTDIFYISQTG